MKNQLGRRVIFFIFLSCAGLAGCASQPFKTGTRWVGAYECRQGVTDLELTVVDAQQSNVKAIFHFRHDPSRVEGSFYMYGLYNAKTRELKLYPGDWINRPPGYITVGMRGRVFSDPLRFEGVITTEGCKDFSVRLEK